LNLILLLSAMLSALIGVGPAARIAQAPVAVSSASQEQVAATPARAAIARPQQDLPAIVAVLSVFLAAWLCLPAGVPAWKMRRRE